MGPGRSLLREYAAWIFDNAQIAGNSASPSRPERTSCGKPSRPGLYFAPALALHSLMASQLSIIIIEKERDRALMIADALSRVDDYQTHIVSDVTGLRQSIAERNPDVVLVDLTSPTRDMLEELALASGPLERPVALFVDRTDSSLTRQAVEAGVSAYVVDGLHPNRIRPVLDAAIARFHMFQRMRSELEATKKALHERKIIERAKGILMRSRGLGEDEAYALLRSTAMDKGRRISDVAEALVTAADLLS
ncbi:ANTAR domain-containing protein (plasmid) [Sulfitobacter sp. LCG007]